MQTQRVRTVEDTHLIVTSVSSPSPPASTAFSKDIWVFSGASCLKLNHSSKHQLQTGSQPVVIVFKRLMFPLKVKELMQKKIKNQIETKFWKWSQTDMDFKGHADTTNPHKIHCCSFNITQISWGKNSRPWALLCGRWGWEPAPACPPLWCRENTCPAAPDTERREPPGTSRGEPPAELKHTHTHDTRQSVCVIYFLNSSI